MVRRFDSRRGMSRGDQGKGNGRWAADTQGGDRPGPGEGSEEVEIFEEPGRLVVATARKAGEQASARIPPKVDPILGLGKNPGRTGARDGSTEHDRYLYTGD
jgi:hypothetical protein